MGNELRGKKIAFLATDGVEQVELVTPWDAIKEAGGHPELVSIKPGHLMAGRTGLLYDIWGCQDSRPRVEVASPSRHSESH